MITATLSISKMKVKLKSSALNTDLFGKERQGTCKAKGAFFAATPFLSSHSVVLSLPLLGELPLSSVLLFDLGVYMLVFGGTVLMLIAIAHQSLRIHQGHH